MDKERPSEAGTPPQGFVHQQHFVAARSSCHIEEIREPSPMRQDRPLPASDVQPKNEQLPQGNSRPMRYKQELDDSLNKTLQKNTLQKAAFDAAICRLLPPKTRQIGR